MLEKLSCYGIQNNKLNWSTDYLFLRKQIVQFKGVLSEPSLVFSGVPQGSILWPLLFSIHFNDTYKPLCYSNIITYADDTVILTSSKDLDGIQHNLGEDTNSLASWFRDNNNAYFYLLWPERQLIQVPNFKITNSAYPQLKTFWRKRFAYLFLTAYKAMFVLLLRIILIFWPTIIIWRQWGYLCFHNGKTWICSENFHFLGALNFNSLPLKTRQISSKLLFRKSVDEFLCTV